MIFLSQYFPFFVVFVLLIFSCEPKKSESLKVQRSNEIFLVFDHPPVNNKYTFKSGIRTGNGGDYEISYVDDHGISRFEPLKYNEYDTIFIKSERAKVEITCAYMGIDKLSYMFQNGDSVLFRYDSLKPWATVLNRNVSEYALNYDLKKREYLYQDNFPEYVKFFNPFFFYGFDFNSGGLLKESDRVQGLAREKAVKTFEKEDTFLDSLYNNGLISMEEARYLEKRSLLHLKLMALQQEIGFRPLAKLEKNLSISDLQLNTNISLEAESASTPPNLLSNDSDMYFEFQDELLDWLLYNYFSRKVGRVMKSISRDGKETAGSNLPNYRELYDTIKNSELVSGKNKNKLLLKSMEELIPQSSLDQRKAYINKFSIDSKNTAMTNFLISEYHFGQSDNSNLALVSLYGDTIDYNKLLKELKNKVVYVDFWASWCAPCLKEMPFSKKLQEHYQNQDIVFLFISIDREKERWLISVRKQAKGKKEMNYLIINQFASDQFAELDMEFIPRYMLFDKKGVLVEKHAPRPSSDELVVMLDRYLAE